MKVCFNHAIYVFGSVRKITYVLLVQDGLQIRIGTGIGTGTDHYAPFNTHTYWRQFLYQFNELVNVIVVGTSLQVSFNLEPQPDYIIKEWRNQIWPFCTHLLWVNLTFVRCVIGKQPSGQNGAICVWRQLCRRIDEWLCEIYVYTSQAPLQLLPLCVPLH